MSAARFLPLLALLAGLHAATAAIGAENPTGMAYLKIGAGADAVGMANAVVSNVDGPSAAYWNPGAIGFLPGFQATVVHNESFESIRQEFAGVSRNFGRLGAALSFQGTWTEELDAYDEEANYLGTFGYYGMGVGLSAGYRLADAWGAGATAKYLREAVDVFDASGLAFDFGIQGRGVLPRLDVGISVTNVGGSLEYVDQPFDLPMTIQGGASYHLPIAAARGEALLAAEYRKVRDEDGGMQLGFEYRLQQVLQMRAGYRSGLDTEDVSFGIGLSRGELQADYAYVPFGEDLGSQHRIGLTWRRLR